MSWRERGGKIIRKRERQKKKISSVKIFGFSDIRMRYSTAAASSDHTVSLYDV